MKLLQYFNVDKFFWLVNLDSISLPTTFLYYNVFCYNYDVINFVDFHAFDATALNKSLVATPGSNFKFFFKENLTKT